MARNPCGCLGAECACKIVSSDASVGVSGKGTSAQPYDLVNNRGNLVVVDTATINLTKGGDGSLLDPYAVSADLIASIKQLSDVDHSTNPTSGQVLAWDGTKYKPTAPVTATPGAINHDASLKGDGSSGQPLGSQLNPSGLLEVGTLGLGLSSSAIAALNKAIRPLPAPQRVLRAAIQDQDYFPSNFWVAILGGVFPNMPAGWYDLSGRISVYDNTGGVGDMGRGSPGYSRIVAGSAGGPGVLTNGTAPLGTEDGEQTDYWQGVSMGWPLKGTYHHTGGELRFALDTIALAEGLNCGVSNKGTYLVLTCTSMD